MKILFCGGGALASHALLLGRDLEAELALIDDDRVETRNLASQWFVKQMVGKNKAAALKAQLQNFYGVRLQDYSVRLTRLNLETILGPADLVVDCFDNADSRHLVQEYVRVNEKACLHGGLAADGRFGVVRWDENFTIDSEDVPGQATCDGTGFLPLITIVSAALVRSIRDWMRDGAKRNWNVSPTSAESF